jgi:hypothetical protein
MIKTVTITGADDSINPVQLLELSKKYSFVEWAILFSRNQQGANRFPTMQWVRELNTVYDNNPGALKLSCHLCGGYVRELLMGNISFVEELPLNMFSRVQINTHGLEHAYSAALPEALNLWPDKEFIFQYDNENANPLNLSHKQGCNVSALFDLSHGAGILPESWPSPLPGIKSGYAGGIGPDNIDRQMHLIEDLTGLNETWIDMETRVRSSGDKQFDLTLVEECLEAARKHMVKHITFGDVDELMSPNRE